MCAHEHEGRGQNTVLEDVGVECWRLMQRDMEVYEGEKRKEQLCRKKAGERRVGVKTRMHRKNEKRMNELKEKQQTTAMGQQMEGDAEIAEDEFWSSGLWVVCRRTGLFPAVAVHH